MKKKQLKMTRRQVLKAGMIGGAGLMLPLRFLPAKAFANTDGQACAILADGTVVSTKSGLSDPSKQPKFEELAPNALDPGFLFKDLNENGGPMQKPNFSLRVREIQQETGLIDPKSGRRLKTNLWGYGKENPTWPGQTIQVKSYLSDGDPETVVRWENELQGKKHLLPVDTSLHWCYSLHGDSSANGVDYTQYSIKRNGVPIVTHLHGGFSDFQFDGNPEFFYSPDGTVKGPQWDFVDGGFTNTFHYDNAVKAGNLWYHDHALGITRLNVYAGLAGFYFVRDEFDTGMPGNPENLPAFPYELAYAIQDRMFTDKGDLFYPAFPGDPYWWDFITDQGLNDDEVPQPSALAEFFGDHMVVNGKIWPKEEVEPRNYRMHLLNGTDSRFMAIRFRLVGNAVDTPTGIPANAPILPFKVIGSDQGLASAPKTVNDYLVSEPGSRYDIIFNFKEYVNSYSSTVSLVGKRIIMENIGGDTPFGGDVPGEQVFEHTNKIMAFDVVLDLNERVAPDTRPDVTPTTLTSGGPPNLVSYDRLRKVALFEGMDEFGRLQPLLGTAEPATDFESNDIDWPNTEPYIDAGLVGPMEGSIAWHSPTTENPALNDIEEWEIFNVTGDAHPVHLHLVNFKIIGRQEIKFDSNADDDGFIPEGSSPADDGAYLVEQPVVQHNGLLGKGFRIVFPSNAGDAYGAAVDLDEDDGYVENAPKDMATALPGQITRIRAEFLKPGRYVWHCHILSHEDHEMMRVLEVTPPPSRLTDSQ